MYEFTIGSKSISVFPGAEPDAPVIYLNTYANEGLQVFQTAQAAGCPPFTLVTIGGMDWNRDMAPWDSPAAFKGEESSATPWAGCSPCTPSTRRIPFPVWAVYPALYGSPDGRSTFSLMIQNSHRTAHTSRWETRRARLAIQSRGESSKTQRAFTLSTGPRGSTLCFS